MAIEAIKGAGMVYQGSTSTAQIKEQAQGRTEVSSADNQVVSDSIARNIQAMNTKETSGDSAGDAGAQGQAQLAAQKQNEKNMQLKKAVDDIILGFAGEENPKRVCDYGLTEKGAQMLRDAADPSLPHTYAWSVLTDYNTAQEQLFCELTLEEAIQLYQASDAPEKRLGVTKDSIATVDIVHMAGGEQRFFTDYQKLESFKSDPVIYEAVGRLHQELVQSSSAQNMNMGGM